MKYLIRHQIGPTTCKWQVIAHVMQKLRPFPNYCKTLSISDWSGFENSAIANDWTGYAQKIVTLGA